jgi:hypothetical protein
MNVYLSLCVCWLASIHVASTIDVIFGHEDESKNMLKDRNWDFEQDISTTDWGTRWGTVTSVTDSYTGGKAVQISGR